MEKNHNARFIKPMECLPVEKVPEGDNWTYELKLDGYRLQAVKAGGKVILYSRRGIDLTKRFPHVARALASLPDDTVIDGELVALDEEGKPNFNLLQNFRSADSHIVFYAFDILIYKGHDLKQLPLSKRRAILATAIEPSDHVGLSYVSDKTAAQMLSFVRSHGIEGVVAKKADSVYQAGLRTGVWTKTRINLGQTSRPGAGGGHRTLPVASRRESRRAASVFRRSRGGSRFALPSSGLWRRSARDGRLQSLQTARVDDSPVP
ncbi:MAG TPA: RNA ligase family protein [Silvibacterium sp.]|nr:RNA ligase family protein [Silvibacterium sp.]